MMRRIINWYFSRKALPYWCILVMDCVIVFLSGLFVLHGLLHWLSLLLNLLLGRLLHGLACRRSCRSLLAFLRLNHRNGPNRRFGQESQLPAYQVGHIDTYHRVDEWAGIVIGVENERIPILNSHLEDDVVEFLLHFLHQVLFGLFQCLFQLHPDGGNAFLQFLKHQNL